MLENNYEYESKLEKYLNERNIVIKYENIASLSKEDFAHARNSGFGASDSAKLLNVSPWGDRMELIRNKVSNKFDETISKKASVRTGSDLEPIILDKAEMLFKDCIHPNDEVKVYKPINMYGSKNNPLTVNYDGVLFINDNIKTIVEAKLVTRYGLKYYNLNKAFIKTTDGVSDISYISDIVKPDIPVINIINYKEVCNQLAEYYGIPIYYFTQVQQQLASMNSDYGYLVVQALDTWETYIFKVYKHQELIDILEKEAIRSWAMVEAMKANI